MKYENGALSLILKIRGLQQTGGWKYVILENSYGRGYRRRLPINKKSLVSIVKNVRFIVFHKNLYFLSIHRVLIREKRYAI